jgi:aryl-alcohol dehydrogenase-like predicted oxidoreductase
MTNEHKNGFVRTRLGRTGLEVSEVSLGCWTLGGPNWSEGNPVGWADLDEGEAVRAVELALELGVNHFDTADVYGNGRSEQLLGKVFGSRRGEIVLATKVGWFPGTAEHAYHPLNIRHQIEQSLENLKTDYVDIYYFHHGDFGPDDRYLDDAVALMRRLREEGKVRFIGQSAYTQDDFEKLIPVVDPDVLQGSAHMLNLKMIGPRSRVAKLILERDLGFVAFSPMAQGLLLDKYSADNPPVFAEGDNRRRSIWFKEDFLLRMKPKLAALKGRFGSSTADLVRSSLQYLLSYPAVSCVIPGFRNCEQVTMNLGAAGRHFSREDSMWIYELFKELVNED